MADQEAFQKSMNLGHTAAWEQQWGQAATHYRQAVELQPQNTGALTSLGLALYELGQLEEALRIYLQAGELAPADPVPLEKSARIYERLGKPESAVQASLKAAEMQLKALEVQKAIDNWQAVLRLQPENLLARTRLGMVYDRSGRKQEALGEYLTAAGILQRAGDSARALQLAEYALQIVPENPEARRVVNMIKTGQLLPRPGKPKGDLNQPRLSSPQKASEPQSSGMNPVMEARQKSLADLAALLFEQTEEPAATPQNRRGFAALARGLPGAMDANGDRTRVMMHLSQVIDSLTQGNETQAAAEMERAVDAGFRHPAAGFLLGLIASNDPRGKENAQRSLQQSVKHPDYALVSHLLLGRLQEDAGCLPEAALNYLQALRLADAGCISAEQRDELDQVYEPLIEQQSNEADEPSLKSACETIRTLLMREDWRAHIALARQQLPPPAPDSPPVALAEMLLQTRGSQVVELLSKVRQLSARGNYHSAEEEAFYALQFAPMYLPLHIQMAEMLLKQGHFQAAIRKFLLVSQMYTLRGESGQAIRLLERVMKMAPVDVSVRLALIDLLAAQGREEDAVQHYLSLADLYYQISDLDKTRDTYLAALKLAQASAASRLLSVQILRKVADLDLQRMDIRQAMRSYEQIRSLQPEDAQARSSLVELNIRLGQDEAALAEMDSFTSYLEGSAQRKRAQAFLQALVKEHPERLDIRKRLADLYIRDGQTALGVQELDAIAEALLVSRNKAAAMSILEAIIALNPPNVVDYRAALAQLRAGL